MPRCQQPLWVKGIITGLNPQGDAHEMRTDEKRWDAKRWDEKSWDETRRDEKSWDEKRKEKWEEKIWDEEMKVWVFCAHRSKSGHSSVMSHYTIFVMSLSCLDYQKQHVLMRSLLLTRKLRVNLVCSDDMFSISGKHGSSQYQSVLKLSVLWCPLAFFFFSRPCTYDGRSRYDPLLSSSSSSLF